MDPVVSDTSGAGLLPLVCEAVTNLRSEPTSCPRRKSDHRAVPVHSAEPVVLDLGFAASPDPGGSALWPRWSRQPQPVGRFDAVRAANGDIYLVDLTRRPAHLSVSRTATWSHGAERSLHLRPVQPRGDGLSKALNQNATGTSSSDEY